VGSMTNMINMISMISMINMINMIIIKMIISQEKTNRERDKI